MLEDKLDKDIKSALLAGDSHKATTLRGLKATLLNIKVATGKRDSGLDDNEVLSAFAKEAKKRQESADLYKQAGDDTRAKAELDEKAMIEAYLPEAMSEEDIAKVIDEVIKSLGADSPSQMGQVIGQVKAKLGAAADGSVIARLTKEKLQ
ncbi:MAG TPA: GatB/YqeY domain-containing protein [Candidatus Saccharimonadales bacterium]|nr:GatB/YqeY domain-containing protein [Candidatus Saccharimonadales bacterium]